MKTYTMTKRFNGEVIETGLGYLEAINKLDQHTGYDVIIHPDNETMSDYQVRMSQQPYDIAQSGWAFI